MIFPLPDDILFGSLVTSLKCRNGLCTITPKTSKVVLADIFLIKDLLD